MVNITLSIPEELKKEMEKFPEMNWSVIAREAIKQRVIMLEKFRRFAKNSSLTREDAVRLGREVNQAVSKRINARR
ncbi:MAG: hypothetical protein KKA64_01750 [Nanoarchaeota archaeon]|nr:hypothetical protein [Nanoarchaeota archaeon]